MHKIRVLCLLIRTEPLQKATSGRGGNVNGYITESIEKDVSICAYF